MKEIYFTKHAKKQIIDRNTTEEEVILAIQNGKWYPAEKERLTTSFCFQFNKEHFGRFYKTKEVVPIFVEGENKISVITVYTFFSQKEAG